MGSIPGGHTKTAATCMGGCRFGIPAGSEPHPRKSGCRFARAKRRPAEGTPLGVSADSQIHPKCSHPYGWLPFWHTRRKRTRRVRASEATLRRLVAGKAPGQSARYACRLACCACRSSSQKSQRSEIFGSSEITPLGVSAIGGHTGGYSDKISSKFLKNFKKSSILNTISYIKNKNEKIYRFLDQIER